jgi:hypothetical protein
MTPRTSRGIHDRASRQFTNYAAATSTQDERGAAGICLEALMATSSYQYTSEFARRHYDAGFAVGTVKRTTRDLAESLLEFLDKRGVELTPEERERISQCTDAHLLGVWTVRSANAATADALFGVPEDSE